MKAKIILLLMVSMLAISSSFAQRTRYSGSRHASSHGGHFSGSRGSSHKGGHYTNSRTKNHYGRHKK
jgi:hypothetical protein